MKIINKRLQEIVINIEGRCICSKVQWSFKGDIGKGATTCNCTACSKLGTIWLYGHIDKEIKIFGSTQKYERDLKETFLYFHFCSNCSCIVNWVSQAPNKQGLFRAAVNLRLCDKPELISDIPINHFDGLNKFDVEPAKGFCIKDIWY